MHLLRHPVALSLSCLRNGWALTLPAFLDSEWFVSAHLGSHEGYCRDVMAHGPSLEAFVLNWVLENLVMLRAAPTRPALTRVHYEDLVLEPAAEIERLADRLGLPAVGAMTARVSTPSVSSGRSTSDRRAAMTGGDREALASGWRTKVDDDDLDRARALLERFDVDVYSDGD